MMQWCEEKIMQLKEKLICLTQPSELQEYFTFIYVVITVMIFKMEIIISCI